MTSPGLPGNSDTIVLRPVGAGRYFEAVFLGVWLAFWSIFEALVIAVLGSMLLALFGLFGQGRLTGVGRAALQREAGLEVGFTFVFLGLAGWLALWTVAGVAAGYRLLRSLAGSDRLAVLGGALELSWRAGPFRRRYRYDRTDLRRIRIRGHDKALVADIESGTRTLSDLGTAADREAAHTWLLSRLGLEALAGRAQNPLAAPLGWTVTRDDSGGLRLSRPMGGRRTAAAVIGGVAAIGAIAILVDLAAQHGKVAGPIALVVVLALVAAWIRWARAEWLARQQHLTYRLQFGPFVKQREFRHATIALSRTVDSDGDVRYRLRVVSDAASRTIASAMYDDTELADTGRWLESVTGFRFS